MSEVVTQGREGGRGEKGSSLSNDWMRGHAFIVLIFNLEPGANAGWVSSIHYDGDRPRQEVNNEIQNLTKSVILVHIIGPRQEVEASLKCMSLS